MTYYINQQRDLMEQLAIGALDKKDTKSGSINQVITQLLVHIHDILIITNISAKHRKRFYSLKLTRNYIQLIEKKDSLIATYLYDMNTKKLSLNDKPTKDMFYDFGVKIMRIVADLKDQRAFAYEKRVN